MTGRNETGKTTTLKSVLGILEFNKDMNINGGIIKEGKDDSSRKLTEEEKTKYEKEVKEEINKLLDDVYKAGEE